MIPVTTFAGKRVDPEALNPIPRLEPDRPAVDPAVEAAEAWADLRAGLSQWAGAHYGRGRD